MNLHEISERLYDDTFLLGRFRRKAALRVLLESSDPEAIGLLVQALRAEHADAKKILAGLGRLSVAKEPAKVVALWEAFSLQPFAALAKVLARLGWPPGQPASARTLRDVLAVATADTGPEIMAAVAAFAEAQPVGDEGRNDEIYGAWIRSQSEVFERLIREQGRRLGSPETVTRLAEAVGKNHPQAKSLLKCLLDLSPEREPEKVAALWAAFGLQPRAEIAEVLFKLGWPTGHPIEAKILRNVLAAAAPNAPRQVLEAAGAFARALPVGDEGRNDEIYGAWIRSQSEVFERLIREQGRRLGSPGTVTLLAEVVGKNHPQAKSLLKCLLDLSPEREPEKVAALWAAFGLQPRAEIAEVLFKLGWPTGHPIDGKILRNVLAAAAPNAPRQVLEAAGAFARALPVGDEGRNDEIYGAWIRSQSEVFERLIREQGRQPGNPVLEALYVLATGNLRHYERLKDDDGGLLVKAYAMAPPALRDRIGRTIADSTDRRIKNAFQQAQAEAGLDPAQVLANLKLVNDEDGLFELTRHLTLLDVLGLCGRWADMPGRPTRPEQAAVVDRALTAYRALGQFQVEPGPTLPEGLVGLFDYWRGQNPSDADLRADLTADDPFAMARGLYLGHERAIVDAPALAAAATSEHWPLRLVARLLDPATLSAAGAAQDHVLWVSACAGDAALLSTPIGGSPKDYARHSRQKAEARGGAAGRIRALLEILCAFQGAFVASEVSLEEIDEPTVATGVTLEDAPEVDFD